MMEEVGIGSPCSLFPGVFQAEESRGRLTEELETELQWWDCSLGKC